MGLDVLLAVKCGGMGGGAALPCLSGEEEEEQPARNAARKSQPSRIELIIPALVRVAAPVGSEAGRTLGRYIEGPLQSKADTPQRTLIE